MNLGRPMVRAAAGWPGRVHPLALIGSDSFHLGLGPLFLHQLLSVLADRESDLETEIKLNHFPRQVDAYIFTPSHLKACLCVPQSRGQHHSVLLLAPCRVHDSVSQAPNSVRPLTLSPCSLESSPWPNTGVYSEPGSCSAGGPDVVLK